MLSPQGLGIDENDFIYVGDSGNHRIVKFEFDEATGSLNQRRRPWPAPVEVPGAGDPKQIASDGNGQLFTTWATGGYVIVFDTDGNYIRHWGGGGELDDPHGIAVGNNGWVYIAETGGDLVKVYDQDGNHQFEWGGTGIGNDQLNRPERLWADDWDRIFVADTDNDRVEVFDQDGNYLHTIGQGYGSDLEQMNNPNGVAVSHDGFVYVTDRDNNRIQRWFDPPGQNGSIGLPMQPGTGGAAEIYDDDGDSNHVGWCYECGDPGGGGGLQVIADGLEGPHQLAFGYGGLFVTDELGGTIWKIAPDGTISEFVTGLTGPSGIAFSPDGVLHVSDDDHRVVSYDTDGTEHLVLDPAAMPDDAAPLENPNAIAFDAAGNLFIANADDGTISKLDADGVTFTRMFATGFALPQGLVVDDSGNLWVADQFGNITELDPDSGIPTGSVLATGNNNDGGLAFRSDEQAFYMPSLGDDGIVLRVVEEPFTVEDCLGGMQYPIGVAIGLDGWIYVADYAAGQVLRSEGCGGGGDPGGSPYELYADGIAGPYHHAWDDAGNLFVADENGNMVWRIDRNTGERTQFGPEIFGASGVAFDSNGILHVSDDEGRIVALDESGTLTEVVTGLSNPNAIAFDPDDNLYIATAGSGELLRLPSGGTIEPIAGGFDTPQGVVVDPDPDFVWVGGMNGTISRVWVGATVPGLDTGDVVDVIDTGHGNDGGLTYRADEQAFYAPSPNTGGVIRVPNDGSGDVEECLQGIAYPRGVSIGPDGWIYVSDFERGEIVRAEGCGDPGGGPEPFNFFNEGDVLISSTDGRLLVYHDADNISEYGLPFGGNFDIQYMDSNTLLIAAQDQGVMALDLASGDIWPLAQQPDLQAIAVSIQRDRQRMFISDEDSGVWIYEWINDDWWDSDNATLTLLIDEVPDPDNLGETLPRRPTRSSPTGRRRATNPTTSRYWSTAGCTSPTRAPRSTGSTPTPPIRRPPSTSSPTTPRAGRSTAWPSTTTKTSPSPPATG